MSAEYRVLAAAVPPVLLQGFAHPAVAERQRAAFTDVLERLKAGRPREDFVALAKAVDCTGLTDPLVVEIGCGSGWNIEVLHVLLKRAVRYVGVDYSPSMARWGRQDHPGIPFVVGDAAAVPLRDKAADILLSGTVLMHVLDYRKAIAESRRVARQWCIFHTVPVLQRRATTVLSKQAYGRPTVEVVFNEHELHDLFEQNGLRIREIIDSLPYDLEEVVGEPTVTKTYVCSVHE